MLRNMFRACPAHGTKSLHKTTVFAVAKIFFTRTPSSPLEQSQGYLLFLSLSLRSLCVTGRNFASLELLPTTAKKQAWAFF
jgi:hypothetical protein